MLLNANAIDEADLQKTFYNEANTWAKANLKMTMTLSLQSKIKLSGGNEMPIVGFGTYELDDPEAYQAVTDALEAGYRHIDSAAWYENERAVGRAIRDFCAAHSVLRSSIFYTTKLKMNNGYDATRKAIQKSLDLCGLGYIDLYLIHGPMGGPQKRKQSWTAIVDAQRDGLVKSIGISTFGVRHIKDILDLDIGVPAVHQIDLHPFMTREKIVQFSREHGMVIQAWAPLVRAMRFNHPAIVALAQKYSKDPAQILLRYSLQKGYVPLPKSASKDRIVSNTHVFDFELGQDDMEGLDRLDEYLVTDWDPTDCA